MVILSIIKLHGSFIRQEASLLVHLPVRTFPDSHLYWPDIGCISAISRLSLLCRADIGPMLAILAVRTMQPTSGQYRSDAGDTGSI